MNKQDPQGGPPTTPPDLEAELAREREAKAQMRERLRNTEALAAESHALRARMAQELEKVTGERDRLRAESAAAAAMADALAVDPPPQAAGKPAEPVTAAGGARPEPAGPTLAARPGPVPDRADPRLGPAGPFPTPATSAGKAPASGPVAREPVAASSSSTTGAGTVPPPGKEWSTRPPKPQGWRGPWKALGLLAGVAACAAAIAWVTGTMPTAGLGGGSAASPVAANEAPATQPAATPAPTASTVVATDRSDAAAQALDRAASAVAASRGDVQSGPAVALAPVSASGPAPETLVATAPTAAAPPVAPQATASVAAPASPDLAARLRKTLDGEGIAAPVEIDPGSGRVAVSDPAADNATRDRTDMLIRAVYAGASLPEPQIEHRWLSAPRAGRAASTAAPPNAATAGARRATPPVATAATAAAADHRRRGTEARPAETAAADDEPRIILPMGRITAACKEAAGGTATSRPRGADLTACMRRSCCSSLNRQTEECRAYERAYPFTCSAG